MIMVESKLLASDNAGAVRFKCIRVGGGFRRRFARLGEMVGSISVSRRVYAESLGKKALLRKVRKKRKQKSKKIKEYVRPYETLILALKKRTKRKCGSYLRFDTNKAATFTPPTKFGPHGKSTMIPNFIGTKLFGPVCYEIVRTK
jgi:large subunit ribosomal protein L14